MTTRNTHGGNSHSRLERSRHHSQADLRQHATAIAVDARELAASAKASLYDQLEPMRAMIRERPWRALLAAGGVGVLLGMLLRRH